jgi:hypothetical protein
MPHSLPVRRLRFALASAIILLASCGGLPAQEAEPYTIHVYTNLVQIPALVLSTMLTPLPLIPANNFRISLSGGRAFAPLRVRLEGDDPISLSILIDASGSQDALIAQLPDALAALAPAQLHPEDTVSLFAMDCTLLRSIRDIAPEPVALADAVRNLLAGPGLHGSKTRAACAGHLQALTYMGRVVSSLRTQPGRRVLLVLTDGYDGGSHLYAPDVISLAGNNAVAIFGLRDSNNLPLSMDETVRLRRICESSGGMVLNTSPRKFPQTLSHFVDLVRGRYILEFQRPHNMKPGVHALDVSVARQFAFIRTAGATMPTTDPVHTTPEELAVPAIPAVQEVPPAPATTPPTDPSPATPHS